MNHLKAGVVFSLAAHLVLFAPRTITSLTEDPAPEPRDYHLPIAVKLTHRPDPSKIKPEAKPESILPRQTLQPKLKPEASAEASKPVVARPEVTKAEEKSVSAPLTSVPLSAAKAPKPSEHPWNEPPVYPDLSRRRGEEGKVVIEVFLKQDGRVASARVARSSTHALLDQAALDAVRGWRLDAPAAGSARLFIPITFKLRDESGSLN
jgi:protein TonB